MLLFNDEQQAFVNDQRSRFNKSQRDMAVRFGLNGRMAGLEGNAMTVPKDAWGRWDTEGIEVARNVLSVFNDLAATNSKPGDLAVLVDYFQTVSDSGDVNISLDGVGKAKGDQPVIDYYGTPLPIIDSEMSVGWRQMLVLQRAGGNYTSAGSNNHYRKVAEKLEDIVLNGDSKIKVGSDSLLGLRNHPERNTGTHSYTLRSATGAQWLEVLLAGMALQHAANFYTEVTVYLNWQDLFYANSTDFSTQYPNKTIAQRLIEIGGVRFVGASKIPANEMILVCKRRDVIEIINGMPMFMRPKIRQNPEDAYVFQFLAAAAPQIKFDAAGQCGITQLVKT